MMIGRWTWAQVYALGVGIGLVLAGAIGLLLDTGLGSGGHLHGNTDLVLELNGWHNVLHLAFGVVGLATFRSPRRARGFALAWGSTAAVLLIWGFASSYPVAGLIPVNTADNYFHILDATGILVAILSAARFAPRPVRRVAGEAR